MCNETRSIPALPIIDSSLSDVVKTGQMNRDQQPAGISQMSWHLSQSICSQCIQRTGWGATFLPPPASQRSPSTKDGRRPRKPRKSRRYCANPKPSPRLSVNSKQSGVVDAHSLPRAVQEAALGDDNSDTCGMNQDGFETRTRA